jgi:hypothetical protein
MESSSVDTEQLQKFKAIYCSCLVLLHSNYFHVKFDACTLIYQRYLW